MPDFGERLLWYGLTLVGLGGAALLTPQVAGFQRVVGWVFIAAGLSVILYIESSGIQLFLHASYARFGAPYPYLSLIVVSLIGAIMFGVSWQLIGNLQPSALSTTAVQPTSLPTAQIAPASPPVLAKSVVLVSSYTGGGVPIAVPAHSMAYVLPLRAKPDSAVVFGIAALFSVTNGTDKTQTWPPESIQPKRKPKEPIWMPEWSWLCEVKNMGETPILDATLTFTAHFGDDVQSLPVRIGALNVGDTFRLWIVNETNSQAIVDRPVTITVQVPGESERRTVPLTQGGSGLMDILPNLMFVPTRNNWP